MLEWSAPGWLGALALLPPLYWLHRLRAPAAPYRVAALFLWQGPAAAGTPGRSRAHVDPRWRLRALFLALLALAAAGPRWSTPVPAPVTLWLDHRPSLEVREPGPDQTRLELILADAGAALARAGNPAARLRTLAEPGRVLDLEPLADPRSVAAVRAWLGAAADPSAPPTLPEPGRAPKPESVADPRPGAAGAAWPEAAEAPAPLPPAPTLARGRHWLLTDGADPRLAAWLAKATFERILQAGQSTENAALLQLGARPVPGAHWQGGVTILNAGLHPVRRTLHVHHGSRTFLRQSVELAPGATGTVRFSLPADALPERLEARLEPADALSADDQLRLVLTEGLPRVQVDAACPAPLRAAVSAMPGLHPEPDPSRAALRLGCGGEPPAPPAIWLARHGAAVPVPDPPLWSARAGPLAELALDDLPLRAYPAPPRPDAVLLAAGGQVLIAAAGGRAVPSANVDSTRRGPTPLPPAGAVPNESPLPARDGGDESGPGKRDSSSGIASTLAVYLELEAPGWARHPALPLLLEGLVAHLLATDPVDPVLLASRPALAAAIAPQPLPGPTPPAPAQTRRSLDLVPPILGLALLLLLADLLRGGPSGSPLPRADRATAAGPVSPA